MSVLLRSYHRQLVASLTCNQSVARVRLVDPLHITLYKHGLTHLLVLEPSCCIRYEESARVVLRFTGAPACLVLDSVVNTMRMLAQQSVHLAARLNKQQL